MLLPTINYSRCRCYQLLINAGVVFISDKLIAGVMESMEIRKKGWSPVMNYRRCQQETSPRIFCNISKWSQKDTQAPGVTDSWKTLSRKPRVRHPLILHGFIFVGSKDAFTGYIPWMKEVLDNTSRGGAYLRCPVFTSVHFSLRNEGLRTPDINSDWFQKTLSSCYTSTRPSEL